MYRVIEVAEMLSVSKVTIYKKLKQLAKELKPHISEKEGVSYLTDVGVKIIGDSMKKRRKKKETPPPSLQLIDLNVEMTELKDDLKETEQNMVQEKKLYLEDLIITYNYLIGLLRSQKEKLNTLRSASNAMSETIKDMSLQKKLIEEDDDENSKQGG